MPLRVLNGLVRLSCVLVAGLVATGCGAGGVPGSEGAPEERPVQDTGALASAFREASVRFGVPEEVLLAHAWLAGRFEAPAVEAPVPLEPRAGHVHAEARFGVMHLTEAQVAEGARAAGLSEAQVREELEANVSAAAALLRERLQEATGPVPAWERQVAAGARLAGLHEPLALEGHEQELRALLGRGLDVTTADGERLRFEAVEALAGEEGTARQAATAPGQYPPMQWVAAHPNNYLVGRGGGAVRYVLVHVTEGGYWGTIDWFSQANPYQASTQYVIQSSTGNITQMVSEANAAWHAGNDYYSRNSIGIEHEGYASAPGTWYTEAMYRSSASLVCAIAKRYGIPVDQQHIIGHYQVPNPDYLSVSAAPGTNAQVQAQPSYWGGRSNHYDPGFAGSGWNWTYYLGLISECVNAANGNTAIIIDSNNANNDGTRARIEVSANWTAASSTAGYYGTGYYYASTSPVTDGATFWFYLPAAASRTVDAWWTTGTNRATAAPFIPFDAAGNKLGTAYANQQLNGGKWNTLGTYSFSAGWNKVVLSRWTTEGSVVIADAVRIR